MMVSVYVPGLVVAEILTWWVTIVSEEETPVAEAPSPNGEGEQPKPKKKTRRGSRGGRRRRKPAVAKGGSEPAAGPAE